MADLVLRKGKIVFPDGVREGDLVIDGGQILEISPDYKGEFDREIDCHGKYILPGVIDAHVHMRVPGGTHKEDFMTGSMAALSGGVTTFLDMPNTDPPVIDKKTLNAKRVLAEQDSLANFGFLFGATEENFEDVVHAKNIAAVKIFLGVSTGGLLVKSDDLLDRLLSRVKVPFVFHAEDDECLKHFALQSWDFSDPSVHSKIRPSQCAREAVRHILHLWKKYEKTARVHFAHVSTLEEIDVIRKFKCDNVTAEVTPHHLFLSTADYSQLGSFGKVNPPLRDPEEHEALWSAVRDGIIEVVASDHAPHLKNEKDLPYSDSPAGFPGVETMLPLILNAVYQNRLDFVLASRLLSTNPARIFGLQKKGKIEVGYDADIVIVDMDSERVVEGAKLLTKCAWSPFEGMKLRGWPTITIAHGTIMYENGKFVSGKRGKEAKYMKS
ncbi:MAG: dihydroorotase [Patescibacteria group bacterium]